MSNQFSVLFPSFTYDPSLPRNEQVANLEKVLKKKFKELVYNEKIDEAMDYLKAIVLDLNLDLRYLDIGLFYISCLCMKVLDVQNAYLVATQICNIKYRSKIAFALCEHHKTRRIENFIKCARLFPRSNHYLGNVASRPEISNDHRFKLIEAIDNPNDRKFYLDKFYFKVLNKADQFEQSIKVALKMPNAEKLLIEWIEEAVGVLTYEQALDLLDKSISHYHERDQLLSFLCMQFLTIDSKIAYLLYEKIRTVKIAKELDLYFM